MLPVPSYPIYQLTLPSNQKKVKYRPWNGLEEKSLQIALLDEDKQTIKNTIDSVIDVCTFHELNVTDLPDVDIDWLITQLRSKSVGEIVELTSKCTNCKKDYEFGIDLTKAFIEDNLGKKRDEGIKVGDDIWFKLRLPTKEELNEYINDENASSESLIASMLDVVYTSTEVFNVQKDYSKKELIEYVQTFNKRTLKEVYEYVDNSPRVVTETKVTCKHCKTEYTHRLEGADFFID